MKNDRTPRTLADCDFSVGYPITPPSDKRSLLWEAIGWATLLVSAAGIGVILAWRG